MEQGGTIGLAENKFRARKMVLEDKYKGQEKWEWATILLKKKAQISRLRRGKQIKRAVQS